MRRQPARHGRWVASRIGPAVTDTSAPAAPNVPVPDAERPAVPLALLPVAERSPTDHGRWIAAGAVLLTVLATTALVFAWNTQQRLKALESELVKRQQDSGSQATEARTLARQAEAVAREAAAKVALLDARVAETSMQRSQFEELVQSLARSRDENVLADIDAAVRVALQQTAITGSADPLVATLKQAEERLARYNQPRLERVRRAVAQDLERTRTAGVSDIGVLTIRLDEVIRSIDDLPLLSQAERRPARGTAAVQGAASAAAPAASSASGPWGGELGERSRFVLLTLWQEVKSLVRVTRIDEPEAMLLSPDQAFFLRESLKLRLLNARLALLSRQFDTAQLDLRDAQTALDRYFDRSGRRVQAAAETLKQLTAQARVVSVPRPDATLAAIATASAGR